MNCTFCFGRFHDIPATSLIRDLNTSTRLINALGPCFDKITLTGGEPLLCPFIDDLLIACKLHGCTTSLVSNGSPLIRDPSRIPRLVNSLDWFGLSVDSAHLDVLQRLGRAPGGKPMPSGRYIDLARNLHAVGIRLKVNIVVTALNAEEDMRWFLEALRPARVKLFQVMPIRGQNDERIDDLLISEEVFAQFVERHQDIDAPVIAESNSLMSGSYAMIDPAGRFFDNTTGAHRYSRPILEVGVVEAFEEISFDHGKFEQRGGRYAWR